MNFDAWFEAHGGARSAIERDDAELGWDACKEQVLKIIEKRMGPPLLSSDQSFLTLKTLRDEIDSAV